MASFMASLMRSVRVLSGPLGKPIHYVWPRARGDFWPAGVADGVADSSEDASELGGAEMCSVDGGLTEALRLGREVLFAAESGSVFVAVSSSEDEQVRRMLLS